VPIGISVLMIVRVVGFAKERLIVVHL